VIQGIYTISQKGQLSATVTKERRHPIGYWQNTTIFISRNPVLQIRLGHTIVGINNTIENALSTKNTSQIK
jgi:hypothetical protein